MRILGRISLRVNSSNRRRRGERSGMEVEVGEGLEVFRPGHRCRCRSISRLDLQIWAAAVEEDGIMVILRALAPSNHLADSKSGKIPAAVVEEADSQTVLVPEVVVIPTAEVAFNKPTTTKVIVENEVVAQFVTTTTEAPAGVTDQTTTSIIVQMVRVVIEAGIIMSREIMMAGGGIVEGIMLFLLLLRLLNLTIRVLVEVAVVEDGDCRGLFRILYLIALRSNRLCRLDHRQDRRRGNNKWLGGEGHIEGVEVEVEGEVVAIGAGIGIEIVVRLVVLPGIKLGSSTR